MNKKNKYFKKIISILCLCVFCLSLTGCWDYRGLNQVAIVSGVAIDKDEFSKNYKLTFETIDLSRPIKDVGLNYKIVKSEGKTLLDAIRNARKGSDNRMYFGNTPIVIISNQIAKEDGISNIVNWLLRDDETRETIRIIISKQETASEIMGLDEENKMVLSYQLLETIQNDNKVSSSTVDTQAFEAYNKINGEGTSLTLPLICYIDNDGTIIPKIEEIAVFKKDKFVGSFSSEQSKYYLMIMDKIDGGVLSYDLEGDKQQDVSFEVKNNKTKKSYSYNDGKIELKIKTNTTVVLNELNIDVDVFDEKQLNQVKEKSEQMIEKNIKTLVRESQTKYNTDVFDIGSMIYKDDPKLWKKLKDNWDDVYKLMEVEVESKIDITNTGSIRNK